MSDKRVYVAPKVLMRVGDQVLVNYEPGAGVLGKGDRALTGMLGDCDLSKPEGFAQFSAALELAGLEICLRKNHDYADPDSRGGDPMAVFSNFLACEQLGIARAEDGLLVRMTDKFKRIVNLTREGAEASVFDESLVDTVIDLRNYLALLLACIEQRRRAGSALDAFPPLQSE